jgi:hypothetical protein
MRDFRGRGKWGGLIGVLGPPDEVVAGLHVDRARQWAHQQAFVQLALGVAAARQGETQALRRGVQHHGRTVEAQRGARLRRRDPHGAEPDRPRQVGMAQQRGRQQVFWTINGVTGARAKPIATVR